MIAGQHRVPRNSARVQRADCRDAVRATVPVDLCRVSAQQGNDRPRDESGPASADPRRGTAEQVHPVLRIWTAVMAPRSRSRAEASRPRQTVKQGVVVGMVRTGALRGERSLPGLRFSTEGVQDVGAPELSPEGVEAEAQCTVEQC
jgi:hypothetical protein